MARNYAKSRKPRETLEVCIEKMVQGGEGMARLPDGRVCFVKGALPGERCRVEITLSKKDFARGFAVEILEPGPDRVEPRCPLFGRCGGCSLQHLDSKKQAEYIERVERENFRRLARADLPDDFRICMGAPWGYRNRARVVASRDRAGDREIVRFGFREQESNRVAFFRECPVLTPALNGFLQGPAREIFTDKRERFPRELDVNVFDDGTGKVSFYYAGMPAEDFEKYAQGTVDIGGKKIETDASVFFQSNLSLLPELVQAVRDAVDAGLASGEASDEWLIDLFSGVGFFAALLQEKFKRVTTVERDEGCLRHAEVNLSANRPADARGTSVQNVSAPAEQWLSQNVVNVPATLIVDPPRTGLPKEVLDALASSSVNRLIYVSCDPVTLARDYAKLAQSGFAIKFARGFAFYPQTPHLEMLLVASR